MIQTKGAYTLGKDFPYFLVALFASISMLAYINSLQGAGLLDALENKQKIETLMDYHAITDLCFSDQDLLTGRVYPGTLTLEKFTPETLSTCVHHEARLSLKSLEKPTVQTIATEKAKKPTFKPLSVKQLPVLIDGKPYILKMELA